MSKPVIAIDIDDVLAQTTVCLLADVSKLLGQEMRLGDITSTDYWLEYGIAEEEAIKLVHDYNLRGFPDLAPVEGGIAAIERLSASFNLVLITSRDARVKDSTQRWITMHYPDVFSDVVFVGNKFVSKTVASKADICKRLGAVAAIDDDLKYIAEYAQKGVRAILFGDYPWRDYDALLAGAIRCKSWADVEAHFGRG
jgi:5'(3')-deoxyribonucleotidase